MFPSVANTTAMEDRMQGQSQKNVPHHIIKEHVNVGGFPRKKKINTISQNVINTTNTSKIKKEVKPYNLDIT